MKSFEISKFKGVNKIIEASKLEPGEMQELYGAYLNDGSIQSMPMPSYDTEDKTFPVPNILHNYTGYLDAIWNSDTDFAPVAYAAGGTKMAVQFPDDIPANEPVTLMFLLESAVHTVTDGTYSYQLSIHVDNGGNPNPTELVAAFNSHGSENQDEYRKWCSFTCIPTTAPGANWWAVLTIISPYASSVVNVYGHPSQNLTTKVYSGASWVPWSSVYSGIPQPQVMVIDSVQSSDGEEVDQSTTINTPFTPWSGEVTFSGGFGSRTCTITSGIDRFLGAALSIMEVPDAAGDYKRTLVITSSGSPLGGQLSCISRFQIGGAETVNIIPKMSIIKVGNILAVTAPGIEFCFPLVLVDNHDTNTGPDYGAVWFQKNLILTGGGTDGRWNNGTENNKPVYIQFVNPNLSPSSSTSISFKNYSASSVPDKPEHVVEFASHLIFIRNFQYPFRMWYGNAGEVDSFNAYENLSQAEAVLSVEKYGNDLLIFFASEIKKYSGSPRYAVLSTIKETGILNSKFKQKVSEGVFILAIDGLWVYNGVLTRVIDRPQIFNANKKRYMYQATNATVCSSRLVKFPEIHSIGIVLQKYETSPDVVAIWLYDYWAQDWYRYYVSSDTDTGGVMEMAALPYHTNWIRDGAYSGLMLENESKFSPFQLETGWIDVDPRMDKKRFLHFTMEATNPAASQLIDVTIDYDNGTSYAFTDIDLRVTDGSVYAKIEKMVPATASRFKISVSCNTTGTPAPTNEQVKIHKFNIFYTDGKQK